jgi:hypothetical protein
MFAFNRQNRIVVNTIVFQALDVVQNLTAAMGKRTAISRSTDISARNRPDRMAKVRTMYQIHLKRKGIKRI